MTIPALRLLNERSGSNLGGWRTIRLHTRTGTPEKRAQIIGPFAVHREDGGPGFAVSHAASGRFLYHFRNGRAATKAAKRFSRLVENVDLWTVDMAVLEPNLIARRPEFDAIARSEGAV